MMALLRLNTDIPNDVFPSNCRHQSGLETRRELAQGREHCGILPRCLRFYHCVPRAPHHRVQFPHSPLAPLGCPAHISEVWLLAGAFLKEALALSTVLGVFSPVRGDQHMGISSSPVSCNLSPGLP